MRLIRPIMRHERGEQMRLKNPPEKQHKKRGFSVWLRHRPNDLILLISAVTFTAILASSIQTASTFYQG